MTKLQTTLTAGAASVLFATSVLAAGNTTVIDQLPRAGNVTLMGTVSEVNDNEIILQDSQGDTIDVKTNASLQDVNVGDSVRVTGQMTDEALGFGREIERARVAVLSSTDMSTQQNTSRSGQDDARMGQNVSYDSNQGTSLDSNVSYNSNR